MIEKLIFQVYTLLPQNLRLLWVKIEKSNLGNRMASGAFWSLTGSVLSRGLLLIASIVVARILGKTEYGELGMIRSTVNMFAIFSGFGLGLTATKYIAEFKENNKAKAGRIIGLTTLFAGLTGGIITLILLFAAPVLAEKTINAPHLSTELRLGAFILFFSSLNGAQTGVLIGYESFRTIAKINLISGLLALPLQIGFTLLWGITGSVIGFGMNFLLLWVLNFIAVRKESIKNDISIKFKNAWTEKSVLFKFSIPALMSGLLVSPVIWASNALLVNQPRGYEEMAIFDAANQWRIAILFIPSVLSQMILPILASSSNDQAQFKKVIKINISINFIISLVLGIIISSLSGLIMTTYGAGFEEGKLVLIILVFSTCLISINGVIGQAIASKGNMWIGFIFNLFWGITFLSSSYFFLNLGFGSMGLAYAFITSYSFHTIIQYIYLYKYVYINK